MRRVLSEGGQRLLSDVAGQLFHDLTVFYFVDNLLVLRADRATAGVLFGCVQAGLLNVPLGDFQVLINVHADFLLFWLGFISIQVRYYT
jgi:hypothetical protein